MSLSDRFDSLLHSFGVFWAEHYQSFMIVSIGALVATVLVLAVWLVFTRLRLVRFERAQALASESVLQRLSALEASLSKSREDRDRAERILVAAAAGPDGEEGKLIAELRREVATEAINRLEVMRLNRNESALWDQLIPALDEMIVRQVSAISARVRAYAGEEIEHMLVGEIGRRFQDVCENRRESIWAALNPLLDAIIVQIARDLSASAEYALREELSEDLVEQVGARLTIAAAVGRSDPLWQKIEPIFEGLIAETAADMSPREVSADLEPLLAGWILEMAGSRRDVIQAAVTARLGKFVEEIIECSKEQIKAKASSMVEDAMSQSIDSQISQACLASRRYVNALVMAAIPRMVNQAIETEDGPLRTAVSDAVRRPGASV